MTRKQILLAIILPIIFAFGFWYKTNSKETIKFQELVVETAPFDVTIKSTGSVQPEHRIQITPPVSGRVEKIFVREGEQVKKSQILAMVSSLDRVAVLDAARGQGREEFLRWQNMYQPTPIRAPATGTIIALDIVPGQTLNTNQVIFEVSDRLIVTAQVDETDIGHVHKDQKTRLKFDAFAEKEWQGKVLHVSSQSSLQNSVNVFNVLIEINGQIENLRSGMSASVEFILLEKPQAYLVPAWLAQGKENSEAEIFVRGQNGDAEKRTVRFGRSNGEKIEVLANLGPADLILFKPLELAADSNGLFGGMFSRKKKK